MKANTKQNVINFPKLQNLAISIDVKLQEYKNEIMSLKIFWALLIIFVSATLLSSKIYNDGIMDGISIYAVRFLAVFQLLYTFLLIAVIAIFTTYFIFQIRTIPNKALFGSFISFLKPFIPQSIIILRLILAFGSFSLLMGCFVYWKEKIGYFNEYNWDKTFAEWDSFLFSGYQAWEVLHPVLGYPFVTKLLDFFYFFWVLLCVIIWIFVFTTRQLNQPEKHQYLLASLLSWTVIGLLTATYFASGGPVYYHEFTGDKLLYSGLLQYLNSFVSVNESGMITNNLFVTDTQEYLWQVHQGIVQTPGGISAMPSMHNAQAILFVILIYKLSRLIGHLMLGYAIAIYLGSIHLAWHYAVDGFIAAIMIIPIWYFAGWITGATKFGASMQPGSNEQLEK